MHCFGPLDVVIYPPAIRSRVLATRTHFNGVFRACIYDRIWCLEFHLGPIARIEQEGFAAGTWGLEHGFNVYRLM
jgi:hypothetical protein